MVIDRSDRAEKTTPRASSWFSLRRATNDDGSSTDVPIDEKPSICTFAISFATEDFTWTENIVIDTSIYGEINENTKPGSDASKRHEEAAITTKSASVRAQRRRILVPHRNQKHIMLTYSVIWMKNTINVVFFRDSQPPIVLQNLWANTLSVRRVSFVGIPSSDSESIAGNHTMEYDWALSGYEQEDSSQTQNLRLTESEDAFDEKRKHRTRSRTASIDAKKPRNSNSEGDGTSEPASQRFQIGITSDKWSNTLWQVERIQFATLHEKETSDQVVFLVMIHYRGGTWHISMECMQDTLENAHSASSDLKSLRNASTRCIQFAVCIERIQIHFCDERYPQLIRFESHNARNNSSIFASEEESTFVYPELLRLAVEKVTIGYSNSSMAEDIPETLRKDFKLGYLSHVRGFTTSYVAFADLEIDHFFSECNFPVLLSFPDLR